MKLLSKSEQNGRSIIEKLHARAPPGQKKRLSPENCFCDMAIWIDACRQHSRVVFTHSTHSIARSLQRKRARLSVRPSVCHTPVLCLNG